jgi:hypothetical protein
MYAAHVCGTNRNEYYMDFSRLSGARLAEEMGFEPTIPLDRV